MPWRNVAEGTSIVSLRATVADQEFAKGERLVAVMGIEPWASAAFDVAGVEGLFQATLTGLGVTVTDVYAEGDQAYIEMEADPVDLSGLVSRIASLWPALMLPFPWIYPFYIILREVFRLFIRILAWVEKQVGTMATWMTVLGAVAVGGTILLVAARRRH